MRKKLSLVLYMLLVDVVACSLVVFPAYAFQVSSSTTGYVRIASQAAQVAMLSAQRSATLASVAPLISGASAGSVAVRLVAGSVGWPALGIVAGMTLAMLYYNSTQVSALKAAAAPPGPWTIPGATISGFHTTVSAPCPGCGSTYDQMIRVVGTSPAGSSGCVVSVPTLVPGWTGWGSMFVGDPFDGGCSSYHYADSPASKATQAAGAPATSQQLHDYVTGLPATDPNSVESNTVPVGSQVAPTPADATAAIPVPSTGLATSVVPAPSVSPTDVVVNPNATPPAGTETTHQTTQTTTGTATTTTTTTTNPDGSVTETRTQSQEETSAASCAEGNHDPRTFGSILQDHMSLWQGSGLLSALNLLKTLSWPSTVPTYTLSSNLFGSFTLDFSAWSGLLTALRSLIIALAAFVAYRIIFVGNA